MTDENRILSPPSEEGTGMHCLMGREEGLEVFEEITVPFLYPAGERKDRKVRVEKPEVILKTIITEAYCIKVLEFSSRFWIKNEEDDYDR